jgi:hypothetical protein
MSSTAKKLTAVPEAVKGTASVGSIGLARVLAREGDLFRVLRGQREELAALDPAVDPALVEDAMASGARVIVEDGPVVAIVGALQTSRSVAVGRDGAVRLSVERFEVTAHEALLKTHSAFVSIKADEVEIFGTRILSRARELARVLARAIQLN